jgi:hypothetical protein
MTIRWLRIAAVAVLLLAFGVFSARRSIDFPLYHQAASKLLQGDENLYPALAGAGPVSGHGFRYAPVLALLFVPLALMPVPVAAFLFFCLKIPAFIYMWRVVLRRIAPPPPHGRLVLLSVLVTGGYLAEEFRNGNLHFFVIALMVLAFDLAERGRVAIPAGALALAIAAKLLPAVLLAYFVIRRRFAVSLATLAALAALAVAPAAVVGWDDNARLTRTFLRYAVMKIDEQANHSLRGTLFRHLAHNDADDPRNPDSNVVDLPEAAVSTIWMGLSVIGGVMLLGALWRDPPNEESRMLDLSLVIAAIVIGAPHTQRIHFSSLLFPVATLVAIIRTHPAGSGIPLARAALWTVGIIGTLLPLVLSTRRWAVAVEALSVQFLAALLLGTALFALAVRFKQQGRAPGPKAPAYIGATDIGP